jgi:uncharacterized protein (TIGR02246 family)
MSAPTARNKAVLAAALFVTMLAGCGGSPTPDANADKAAIEQALQKWPSDFNAENVDGVCGLFADDVVLVYPDSPDRHHDEFCDQMKKLFGNPGRTFTYAAPDIREVLVDGDLATVRLIWTLTVKDTSGKVLETVKEDGVDVFRRQADGSWKIHVSHAFTREG